ncbi:hypothetical protein ACQPXH_06550 [Nocardia sp. CA-135953]|uniref:hypothetical protein n=1 Tax=Nocardia sp. CA-135953 TaxID=3239978 RepID=UPI003D99CE60
MPVTGGVFGAAFDQTFIAFVVISSRPNALAATLPSGPCAVIHDWNIRMKVVAPPTIANM